MILCSAAVGKCARCNTDSRILILICSCKFLCGSSLFWWNPSSCAKVWSKSFELNTGPSLGNRMLSHHHHWKNTQWCAHKRRIWFEQVFHLMWLHWDEANETSCRPWSRSTFEEASACRGDTWDETFQLSLDDCIPAGFSGPNANSPTQSVLSIRSHRSNQVVKEQMCHTCWSINDVTSNKPLWCKFERDFVTQTCHQRKKKWEKTGRRTPTKTQNTHLSRTCQTFPRD